MALPDVKNQIQDGALGLSQATGSNVQVKLGVCSLGLVNSVYGAYSDPNAASAALGQGPLVDSIAHALSVPGAGPVAAVVLNPSTYGSSGSITHTGPGTGTIAASTAPATQIIFKITTTGTPGTMLFAISINGGGYGSPIATTGGVFSYQIPGTLTTVTFANVSYTSGDTYTLALDGSMTLTGGGAAASNVTHTDSPLDAYSVVITVVNAGAAGVGTFIWSVDGGNTNYGPVLIPSSGKYQLPNTGVVLTFTGTFTAADTYTWATTASAWNNTDLTNALAALSSAALEFGFIHVVGAPTTSSAAAAMAAVVDTQMSTFEAQYRYKRALVECPTTESDATVAASYASFVSSNGRVAVCAGDVGAVSPANGRILRRNCAWVVSAHAGAIAISEALEFVGTSSRVRNVASLYRDEQKTQYLDAARFITMRTFPGTQGYFITRGNTFAAFGSDYSAWQRGRVMDLSCEVTRQAELPYIGSSMRVDPKTGYIDERDAQAFEAKVNSALKAQVVSQHASSSSVVVNRSTNILSGTNLPVTVRVVPFFYPATITNNIGFQNPAISV